MTTAVETTDLDQGSTWAFQWELVQQDPSQTGVLAKDLRVAMCRGYTSPAQEAILLWYMRHWSGEDPQIWVDLLCGLKGALYFGIPPIIQPALAHFMARALVQEDYDVRRQALDLLIASIAHFPTFLDRGGASVLLNVLTTKVVLEVSLSSGSLVRTVISLLKDARSQVPVTLTLFADQWERVKRSVRALSRYRDFAVAGLVKELETAQKEYTSQVWYHDSWPC